MGLSEIVHLQAVHRTEPLELRKNPGIFEMIRISAARRRAIQPKVSSLSTTFAGTDENHI